MKGVLALTISSTLNNLLLLSTWQTPTDPLRPISNVHSINNAQEMQVELS